MVFHAAHRREKQADHLARDHYGDVTMTICTCPHRSELWTDPQCPEHGNPPWSLVVVYTIIAVPLLGAIAVAGGLAWLGNVEIPRAFGYDVRNTTRDRREK
jgi:hypothetical protein